jgi:hypothetical protein
MRFLYPIFKFFLIQPHDAAFNKNTWKLIEIVIIAEKGKSHEVATGFLKYRDNAKNISTSIDSKHRITTCFLYRHPQELQDLLQDIKSIPHVKGSRLGKVP